MSMGQSPNYGRIVSFSLRGKRLGDKYQTVMDEYGEQYLLNVPSGAGAVTVDPDYIVDLAEIFGRSARLVVEIGPGSGEQLVHSAKLHPDWNFLALEAWAPGVARTINNAVRENVSNIRIAQLDAMQALPILFRHDNEVEPQYAEEVWTFFPDPWRKKKHRKRRIVSPAFAHIIAGVLAPNGLWRMATDWDNYAWQMRDVLTESPWFDNEFAGQNADSADEGLYVGGFAPRFAQRVETRFEQRGVEADRNIHDLVGRRNDLPVSAAEIPLDPWIAAEMQGKTVPANRGGERPASSRRGLDRG